MEKRSLRERVPEAPSVPIIKVPRQPPVTVHQVAPLEAKKKDRTEEEKRSISTMEVARAKRKPGRRRVVEFTRDDSGNSITTRDADNHSVRTVVRNQPVATPKKHPVEAEMAQQSQEEASSGAESSPPPSLPNDNVDWSIMGDEYRRKVEALKNEVGSGWLSVLSEEGMSLAASRRLAPASNPSSFPGPGAFSAPR